jgi:hypothetical protein
VPSAASALRRESSFSPSRTASKLTPDTCFAAKAISWIFSAPTPDCAEASFTCSAYFAVRCVMPARAATAAPMGAVTFCVIDWPHRFILREPLSKDEVASLSVS